VETTGEGGSISKMEGFNLEESEREMARIDANFTQAEEKGKENILKHFDRIHDKLFDLNNIMLAGYFALAAIVKSVSVWTFIVPVVNLVVLIFIEYQMMEKSRLESNYKSLSGSDFNKVGKMVERTNWYSLLIICTSLGVVATFMYLLISNVQA
jgi:hypothetical protein